MKLENAKQRIAILVLGTLQALDIPLCRRELPGATRRGGGLQMSEQGTVRA